MDSKLIVLSFNFFIHIPLPPVSNPYTLGTRKRRRRPISTLMKEGKAFSPNFVLGNTDFSNEQKINFIALIQICRRIEVLFHFRFHRSVSDSHRGQFRQRSVLF